eukprot:CAMPEP_0175839546 /NCGR_PEP_ID=MMETSP0107_2-20121207/18869_1 /TAXON_ID=195067 ORGANISM="Goniomonas pacifica, Strain CCMP1869" /NCGR_SAMPLE_ID=MMETSP0107_2 /ASSEMBLY_ACC=CAM_ASM_000203 /LENGTH=62 /DNA_ID=CAMNT_0017153285 /DNA_START=514 /DNA_END=702 /DNA_ORIENTATION=-
MKFTWSLWRQLFNELLKGEEQAKDQFVLLLLVLDRTLTIPRLMIQTHPISVEQMKAVDHDTA